MLSREVDVINRLGLHARAAAKLVGTATRFASALSLSREGRNADAKSIMAVMMLAATRGHTVTCSHWPSRWLRCRSRASGNWL
jgi:phosphocarrier protein